MKLHFIENIAVLSCIFIIKIIIKLNGIFTYEQTKNMHLISSNFQPIMNNLYREYIVCI